MKKRIYVYEMDCYKQASEEQIEKMHIRPDRYFDLEGLPTEEISRLLEEFIWDRGKKLAPSSLSSELLYYNNIRNFLIDRNICKLDGKAEEKIIRMLRGWMMEKGYALSSKKYRATYDKIGIETPGIVKHMKKILKFAKEDDDRDEQEKDVWNLKNFDFPIQSNPILNMETINFTKITQPDIREEVKKAVFMHLKYSPLGTIQSEMTAIKRFAKFLEKRCPDIKSLQELERLHIEQYLIYLQTEAHERKNYRSVPGAGTCENISASERTGAWYVCQCGKRGFRGEHADRSTFFRCLHRLRKSTSSGAQGWRSSESDRIPI